MEPAFLAFQYFFIRADTLAVAAALIFDFLTDAFADGVVAFAFRALAHRAR